MKFDGYRILAGSRRARATLWSRNGKDWTAQFPAVAAAAGSPARAAGAPRRRGRRAPARRHHQLPGAAERAPTERQGQLVYFVFDLLHLDGYDLTGRALEERKHALRDARRDRPATAPSATATTSSATASEFFGQACRLALEGIVSKRRDAPYEPGRGTQLAQGQVHPGAGVRDRRLHRARGQRASASARCSSASTRGRRPRRTRARSAPASPSQGARAFASGSTRLADRPVALRAPSPRRGGRPLGRSPSWWPRSSSPSGRRTAGCAIRRSRGCARTRRRRRSCASGRRSRRPRRRAATSQRPKTARVNGRERGHGAGRRRRRSLASGSPIRIASSTRTTP